MHVTVIIAVFLALMSEQYVLQLAEIPPSSGLGVQFDSTQVVFLVVGIVLLFWSLTRCIAKMLLRHLQRRGWMRLGSLRLPNRISLIVTVAMLGTFALQLTLLGWAKTVCYDWRLQRIVLLDEVALLLPFVALQILRWHSFYPVNRYIKEYIVANQLVDGIAARPVWSSGQYLSFHIRQGLLTVLVPLLLIIGFRDGVELAVPHWFAEMSDQNQYATVEIVSTVGVIAIFILAPLLLRYVWVTRSLPDGPLRQRLEQFCRHLRLRYRDILLWDTYGAVANAAVMGLLAPVRFILLSDALIENMPDEHIEAVFGHEAGHVRHHHILFLVLFVFGSSSLLLLLIDLATRYLYANISDAQAGSELTGWLLSGMSLGAVVAWAMLFGWVSRRFERQGDVHGARACDQFGDATSVSCRTGDTIGVHGIATMAMALERIAVLNGVSTRARSWRHGSIAWRCEFLRRLGQESGLLQRFGRTIIITKVLIVLAVLIGAIGWCWLIATAK